MNFSFGCYSEYNCIMQSLLEYSRSIKPDGWKYSQSSISLYGIQVCSYVLLICRWTWHYITIANSQVFHLQLLGTHWPTHAYLLTITIVIYSVHYLFLALTITLAHTIIYLHIYFVYLLQIHYCILLSHLQSTIHHNSQCHSFDYLALSLHLLQISWSRTVVFTSTQPGLSIQSCTELYRNHRATEAIEGVHSITVLYSFLQCLSSSKSPSDAVAVCTE